MIEAPAIVALVYSDSAAADAALRGLAETARARGMRVVGLVQRDRPRPGRARCDMALEDLASGETIAISQDRGPGARGCSLDAGALLHAMERVRGQLDARPDLVIVNKFGKAEAEGGGLRDLIAATVSAGLRLAIAVPWRNIESWRLFAGDFAREVVIGSDGDAAPILPIAAGQSLAEAHVAP